MSAHSNVWTRFFAGGRLPLSAPVGVNGNSRAPVPGCWKMAPYKVVAVSNVQ